MRAWVVKSSVTSGKGESMSRIGRLPVPIPTGVSVDITDSEVRVKGPKGQLSQARVDYISAEIQGDTVVFSRDGEHKQARANHGLMRALVGNMVTGVTKGFEKKLEIVGVGYRAEKKGKNLVLHLGYSHPVEYPVPSDVSIDVDKKGVEITIQGIDKQVVGQVAAVVRGFREPDSYKGKGVRYVGEVVRLKAGKAAG